MNMHGDANVERRRVLGMGLLLIVAATLLYWLTLDNGLQPEELVGGDLITHQYAQVQARPGNAPGYPLYTMGGWLWFHGLRSLLTAIGPAVPNPIPLLSSYSTLWALLALALLYALLCHITRSSHHPAGNWPLAGLLTAFYAVTYFFWYYATTTEQYTSAIAQTLAILYVYLRWRELLPVSALDKLPATPHATRSPRTDAVKRGEADRLLIFLAFLCGISLAHMLTVAFLVLPVVLAVLWERPALLRNWRLVILCVVAALLPLVSYLYVYLRGAAHPEWWGAGQWRTANEWFWSFVSTAQGRDELSWGFQASCTFFANGFPALIWQELSVVLVVAGLVGIALLARQVAFVLYATVAIYLVFDWMYRCGNWYQVILPAYPLLLVGVAALAERWERHWLPARRWLAYLPLLLLAGLIAWRFAGSLARADSSDRPGDTALAQAAILLDQPLPVGAGLFAPVADVLALDYLIDIWGLQPTVRTVSSQEAGALLRQGGTVLSTFPGAPVLLAELPQDLALHRAGFSPDWLLLQPAGGAPPPAAPAVTVNQPILPGLTLVGYTTQPAPDGHPITTTAPAMDVALIWALTGPWPQDVGVSLRPTRAGALLAAPAGPAGAVLQRDAGAPLQGLWAPPAGDPAQAQDALRVPFPADADGLLLIVYRTTADGFENLLVTPLALPAARLD